MTEVHFIYFDISTGYYPSFHHGLASIFGTLKGQGHKVVLHHLSEERDLKQALRILDDNPEVFALSFTTNQKKYVHAFFEEIGNFSGLIIGGGIHCTLEQEKVFVEFPRFDGICVGEGELPFSELCRHLDRNEDYLNTPNFIFKNREGIKINPRIFSENIDELTLPDYSLFDFREIVRTNGDCFPVMLSRGCPYACSYCCNFTLSKMYPSRQKYVRISSPPRAIEIIKNNLKLYPSAKKITFADDTFTWNKKWLADFCRLYKLEIGLPFICNARVETIDKPRVKLLSESGCDSINFGVESGNEWLRMNILNRKHSNQALENAFKLTKKFGIKSFSFNMVGLPFETEKMAQDTLELNLKLSPDFGKCFYFFPFPGTKLYDLCQEYNLQENDIEKLSGYLQSRSIKDTFMTEKATRKYFELMNLYFYLQLVFSKIKGAARLKIWMMRLIFIARKPILVILDPVPKNFWIRQIRNQLRRLACAYLR